MSASRNEPPVALLYLTLPDSGEVRGGPRSLLLTARHLERYRPVLVVNQESVYVDDAREHGVETHVLPIPRVLEGIRAASWKERGRRLKLLARHNYDLFRLARASGVSIIHCQDPSGVLTVLPAAVATRASMLLHVRDEPRDGFLRSPFILASLVSSRLICIAAPLKDKYVDLAPWPISSRLAARARAIPNGIDFDHLRDTLVARTRESARASLNIPDERFLVTLIGPWTPKKNQLEFFQKAAAGLLRADERIDIALAGSLRANPSYADDCQTAIDALPAPERVRVLGELPHDSMWDLYAASDLVVIPSVVEGLPRVALESQAMGVPVVATDNAGNVGAIVDDVTGKLVPLKHIEYFVPAVTALLDDALRARMSAAARKHAQSTFDVRSVTPRLEAVYDETTAVKPRLWPTRASV